MSIRFDINIQTGATVSQRPLFRSRIDVSTESENLNQFVLTEAKPSFTVTPHGVPKVIYVSTDNAVTVIISVGGQDIRFTLEDDFLIMNVPFTSVEIIKASATAEVSVVWG